MGRKRERTPSGAKIISVEMKMNWWQIDRERADKVRREAIAMSLYRDLWEGARNGTVRTNRTIPGGELHSNWASFFKPPFTKARKK